MDFSSNLGTRGIFMAADDWDAIVAKAKEGEPTLLDDFQEQGGGKNVSPLPDIFFKARQQISVGFGALGLIDRAPFLSKEGQEAGIKAPRNSRRTDVEAAISHLVPQQGKEYFIGQVEKYTEERQNLLKTAKEAIGGGAIRIPRIS